MSLLRAITRSNESRRWNYSMAPAICAAAIIALSYSASAQIKPAGDAPQPLSPQQSATKIRLPKGFRIDLVASEPLVKDPSCIAFDENGRLFVCELHGYNIEGHIDVTEFNKQGVLDKKVRRIRWELLGGKIAEQAAKLQYGVLKLLHDDDGDGRMDRAQVWARDLPPCYGVIPANGGVIVVCAPHIIFFADRDNDGKPEIRETLFSGFRTRVLERSINNPRWGFDGWIYVGGGGDGGEITGPRLKQPVRIGNTDFRIKPDGSVIEPVTGRVGTFGLTINDVGDRFPSTGGRPAMYALPLPHRYLARNPHVPTPETNYYAAGYNRGFRISKPHPWRVKRQQDPAWVKFYGARETDSNYFSGGCSNTFYGDALFPPEYRGNIFYCEPSLNMVHRCVVTRDGAGYKGTRADTEKQSEFLASTDQWFRPMNLRAGPDGAIYIVDMYREIVEDYSAIPRFLQQQYGLDKGKDHGRIWRLAPEGSQLTVVHGIAQLSNDELVKRLVAQPTWVRDTAQRLLLERDAKDSIELLRELLTKQHQAAIRALYSLSELGELRSSDLLVALRHSHFGVRRQALRLCDRLINADEKLAARVSGLVSDTDPTVRLQVAMTLGAWRDAQAVQALQTLIREHGNERWMAAAILSSANQHANDLLLTLLRQPTRTTTERAIIPGLAQTLAGKRDVNGMSLALALVSVVDRPSGESVLRGIWNGVKQGGKIPPARDGWASASRLLKSESKQIQELATMIAGKLDLADSKELNQIFITASKRCADKSLKLSDRVRAAETLAAAPYEVTSRSVSGLLESKQAPALQNAAITALGASTDARVSGDLLRNWNEYTPHIRARILQQVFSRSNRLPSLAKALESKIVAVSELSAIQKEQLIQDPSVGQQARQLLKGPVSDKQLQQRFAAYQAALKTTRNIELGGQLFKKHCSSCHRLANTGYDVGPKLESLINKPEESILADLLDPSSRIESEYRSYIIATEDGRTFTGVLATESPTSITIRKDKGESTTILRRDIARIRASAVSLMPANLHEQMTPAEVAHLLAYIRKSSVQD